MFAVETAHAKRCKDALKTAGWLDKTRRAGGDAGRDGTRRVLLPVTRRGAEALEALVATASRRLPMRANGSAVSLDVSEDAESTDSEVNAGDSEADERRRGRALGPRGGATDVYESSVTKAGTRSGTRARSQPGGLGDSAGRRVGVLDGRRARVGAAARPAT